MSYIFKQGTSTNLVVGPFLDRTDGNTPETGLTIANTDIRISKDDSLTFGAKAVGGATHTEGGYYSLTLDNNDTDTLGNITVAIHISADALPTKLQGIVYPANVYDAMIAGTENLEVDVLKVNGDGTVSSLPASQASVDVVDGNVDEVLTDTGTTIPTQITALNDISPAQVNAECDTAIADAGLSTFNSASDQVIVATNNDKTGYSLTGGVDVTAINGDTDAAVALAKSAGEIVLGAAVTGTLSTTQMQTDLVEATSNHYNGRALIWTSGSLKGQATAVVGYDGVSKVLTFNEVTEAPVIGAEFILV